MPIIKTQNKTVIDITVNTSPDDPEYNSPCTWGEFLIQPEDKRIIVQSDGGYMQYQWQNIGSDKPKDFIAFLCRLPADYLLCKLSEQTVFNFNATRDHLMKLSSDPELCAALKNCEPFFDANQFAGWYMGQNGTHSDDLEAIVMDYPEPHKAAIHMFRKYVVPQLQQRL